jgi:class 3 adenylate cyclase/tetratricopeptide (TPR) repeat protein
MRSEVPVSAAPQRDSGTPSLVSILFADVVSSTHRVSALDAEDARDLLDDVVTRIRQRVHEFGGTLARVQGDGVMAIFGAPIPMEDHALRACCAALAISTGANAMQLSDANALSVRVGVHSGRIITRLQRNDYGIDYDAVGADVHVAAHAEAQAPPNGTVITTETLELAGPRVVVEPYGEVALGQGERTLLHKVRSIALDHDVGRLFATRHLAPFVGRREQLQTLIDLATRLANGHGGAVAILGDAGLGKSRLLYELSKAAPSLGLRVCELRGVSILRRTPFAPLRPFAWSLLDFPDGGALAGVLDALACAGVSGTKAAAVLELLGLGVHDTAWTALEASARRRLTFEALIELVIFAAARRPLLVLAEDLHDFDWESAHFLERLGGLVDRRVGLIVTARSFARERAARVVTHLTDLEPLMVSEARELCAHVAAGSTLSKGALDRAVARASGNPLFLQELVRALLRSDDGRAVDGQTPLSLASLIQARLGMLSPAARTVIQAASILGDDIDPRILALTSDMDEMDLPPVLAELENQDLIERTNPRALRFRHELFRDGARNSLLRTQAVQFHARALDALESVLSDAPQIAERAAFHAERAGKPVRALKHLREACKNGTRHSSLRGVRALYDWAMRFRDEPGAEAKALLTDIVLMSADALQQAGELDEWKRAMRLGLACSQATGNRKKEAIVRGQLANVAWLGGSYDDAIAEARNALELVKDIESVPVRSLALFAMANASFSTGDLDAAIARQTEQVELLAGLDASHLGAMLIPSVQARAYLTWFLAERGDFARAEAAVAAAEAMLAGEDQPYSRLLARAARGILALRQGRPTEAVAPLEEAREICFANDLFVMEAPVSGWLASALVRSGGAERAMAIGRNSVTNKIYLHCAVKSWVIIFQGLAEAEFASGLVDEALATIDKAVAIATDKAGPVLVAQARFARGVMLSEATNADPRSPEVDIAAALQLAERAGLRPLAADCHRHLARLARGEGDADAVRGHTERAAALQGELGTATDLAPVGGG